MIVSGLLLKNFFCSQLKHYNYLQRYESVFPVLIKVLFAFLQDLL